MAAYVLVEMVVTDPEAIEPYSELSGPSLTAHGGRYLARGGASELLEGDDAPAGSPCSSSRTWPPHHAGTTPRSTATPAAAPGRPHRARRAVEGLEPG